MNIERLADGLGAAEGPAFLPDGRFIFVEIWRSRVSVWTPEAGCRSTPTWAGARTPCSSARTGLCS